MESQQIKKVVRIVLTLLVLGAGAYYINHSTTLSKVLSGKSENLTNTVKADVGGTAPPK